MSKKEEEDGLTVNSMIVSWIYNTIDPSIRSTIADREIAKELWDSLKKRFSVTNGVRVQQLTKELVGCTQGTMSVELDCAKLQKLWEDLAQIESKSGCTCAHRAETERVNENRKLHQFLMGLDGSIYSTVRTNILNMDPLPSVDHAYNMVVSRRAATRI